MEADNTASSAENRPLESTRPNIAPASAHRPQISHTCVSCKRRKVKCDRQNPCSSCTRMRIECVPSVPSRLPRGRQGGRKKQRADDGLLERIARLEGLMIDHEALGKSTAPSTSTLPFASIASSGGTRVSQKKGPVHGLNQYLGTSFWGTLSEEINGLKGVLYDAPDDEEEVYGTEPTIPQTRSSERFTPHAQETNSIRVQFIFPVNTSSESLASPTRPEIYSLCDIYLTNVDPVLKVLHAPSLRKYLQGGAFDLDCSPGRNGLEALVFAVYFAAIVTLEDAECRVRFDSEKATLLTTYRCATERALSKADLVNTTEMSTLQALTIYLTSVRVNDNSRFMWTLVSLTVRIAQAMGLHLEATSSLLQPFEREMRRRLWWQICALDAHAAEDRASSPVLTAESFNTKLPLRINDDDIRFGSPQEIKERDSFNDMTFCLICHEVCDTVRQLNYVPTRNLAQIPPQSPQSKWRRRVEMVVQTQKRMEERYVRFLDPVYPFQWTTRMVADLITATMWLLIYRPLQKDADFSMSRDGNADILRLSVDVLERAYQLNTDPSATPFRWLSRMHVQWHAIAITTAELCVQKEGPVVERAWAILGPTFHENAKDVADSEKGMLWAPIKKLMARARRVRHQYLSSLSAMPPAQKITPPIELSDQAHNLANSGEATFDFTTDQQRTPEHNTLQSKELQQANLSSPLAPFDWDPWLALQTPGELYQPSDLDMTGWLNWENFMDDLQNQGDVTGWLNSYGLS